MKRIKLFLPILLIIVSLYPSIYASDAPTNQIPMSIKIDENSPFKIITYEEEPFFPVRLISSTLGYKLSWNAKTKSTLLENDTTKAALTTNKKEIKINDYISVLSKAPVLIDNVLYAPTEFWNKAFNLDIVLKDTSIELSAMSTVPSPEDPTTNNNPTDLDDDIVMPMFEGSNTYYTNQKLIIRLEENPSTSYKWEVTFPEGIELISNYFISNNPSQAGSPGEHTWLIRAVAEGNYTIEFNKIRPLESHTSIDTKVFKLKAKTFTPPQD